jgi:LemA protein
MNALIVLGIAVVLVIVLVWWALATYNSLVKARTQVEASWAQIDVQLKRRHSLIPNLVETVKGYAAHERGTLADVVAARNAAGGGLDPAQRAQAEGVLTQALGRLFALAEAYPDLKANQNFLALQTELSNTEDRLQTARRFYNANVREFNTRVGQFPSSVIAGMFHFEPAEFFEIPDTIRDAGPPQVDFSTPAGGTVVPPAPSASSASEVPETPPAPPAPPAG